MKLVIDASVASDVMHEPVAIVPGGSVARGIVLGVVTTADIERCGRVLADAAASPARVIVFGSHARGTAGSESDLDFLVIERRVTSRTQEAVRLRKALPPLGVPIDVLVMSEEHAARRAQVKGSTVARALTEGRVLAEP